MSKFSRWFRPFQTRSSLAILVTAAVLVEVTGAVQYWFAAKGMIPAAKAFQQLLEIQHRIRQIFFSLLFYFFLPNLISS